MLDSRRVLVGARSAKPQTHVFLLGPAVPTHRRTCFGWDPQCQTTDAHVLFGTRSAKPQTHCFCWGPQCQRCRNPLTKHISNPATPKVPGSDKNSKTTSQIQMLRHFDYYNLRLTGLASCKVPSPALDWVGVLQGTLTCA